MKMELKERVKVVALLVAFMLHLVTATSRGAESSSVCRLLWRRLRWSRACVLNWGRGFCLRRVFCNHCNRGWCWPARQRCFRCGLARSESDAMGESGIGKGGKAKGRGGPPLRETSFPGLGSSPPTEQGLLSLMCRAPCRPAFRPTLSLSCSRRFKIWVEKFVRRLLRLVKRLGWFRGVLGQRVSEAHAERR